MLRESMDGLKRHTETELYQPINGLRGSYHEADMTSAVIDPASYCNGFSSELLLPLVVVNSVIRHVKGKRLPIRFVCCTFGFKQVDGYNL